MAGCGKDPIQPGAAALPRLVGRVAPVVTGDWVRDPGRLRGAPNGELFVDDRRAGEIRVFDAAGHQTRSLALPHDDFAVSSWALATLDASLRFVHVFDPAGQARFDFPFYGAENDELESYALEVTETGHFFLIDRLLRRVTPCDAVGRPGPAFGERGTGSGQFEWIGATAVAPAGTLFVLDTELWRLQEFAPDGRLLNLRELSRTRPFGESMTGALAVDAAGHAWVLDRSFTPGRLTRFAADPPETRSWDLAEPPERGPAVQSAYMVAAADGTLRVRGDDGAIYRLTPETGALTPFLPRFGAGEGEFDVVYDLLLLDDDTLLADLALFDSGDFYSYGSLRPFRRFDMTGRSRGSWEPAHLFNSSSWSRGEDGSIWCLWDAFGRPDIVHLTAGGLLLDQVGAAGPTPGSRVRLARQSAGELITLQADFTAGSRGALPYPQFLERRDFKGRLLQRRELTLGAGDYVVSLAPAGADRFWLLDSRARMSLANLGEPDGSACPVPAPLTPPPAHPMAIDADGNLRLYIFVTDPARVLMYDRAGNQIGEFGQSELAPLFQNGFGYGVPFLFDVSAGGTVALTSPSGHALLFKP